MKKTFLALFLPLSIFFVMGVFLVQAATDGNVGINVTLENPFNCGGVSPCTLFALLGAIIDKIILPIGGVLAVLAFIYSGFLYVTAQGNETKLATAHKALLYTSVGTAVLLGSWVIAKVIENTINQLK
ncbi:MAG: hypothetical protein U1C66_00395 [Patescibacteria group bacterium]|nr:hypothetical protein [bacterium]MDZ4225936.1 hypothetical protein [Patescibacteria group bacterium]